MTLLRKAAPGLLFAGLTLVLFWRVFFLGETLIATDFLAASPVWRAEPEPVRNVWHSDTIEYYYPSEKIYSEHVRRGELPHANPFVFNGAPVPHGVHIWNSVWPVKLAFLFAFDPVSSYDFFAIFHFWLAGVAMFAMLRGLGLGPFAAFAGALAYVLSGRSMLWLHGHYLMATMAYAPLVFLWARQRSPICAIPVAGLFFTNPHAGLIVSFLAILHERRSWKAVLGGALMAGVALVPLAAAVQAGGRDPLAEANVFYADGWRCWLYVAGLIAPGAFLKSMPPNEYNIYLGLIPLVGAAAGFRRERFFGVMAVAALAAATLWPLPLLAAPVSFSLPTRYLFLFTLGACVCFARALELRPMKPWLQAAVVVLVLVDLGPRFIRYNAPYDTAILSERPSAVEVLHGRTGWVLEKKPFARRGPVVPPLSLFGVESVQGYDVMVPEAQEEAVRGAGRVVGDRVIVLDEPDHAALEALGMRYLVTDARRSTARFRLIHEGTVFVYENPAAPDAPPRPVSKAPLWIGLAVTLAGCFWAVGMGLLDRFRAQGYS